MSEIAGRIEQLSPEKKALLLLRLSRKKALGRANGQAGTLPPWRPAVRDGALPLSFAQQRLWFLDQLVPGSPAYNIASAVRLRGSLSPADIEQIINAIVARHEALRTTFANVEGVPYQQIAPVLTIPLPVIELGHRPAGEREAELRRLAAEEARRPFDLASGPLLRTTLLRLAEEEHVLLLTMHHIISDGWSMGLFFSEVAAFSQALLTGQPDALPSLAVQYADYAVWQREWLAGTVLAEQLAYWRAQLRPPLPVLSLPTDRPRPAIQSDRGAHESLRLPAELSRELEALSRAAGTTLFMTL
ncbi:MAG: condensation domain-containing protein, partial [Chloroflexi bacterium]|nr:condensation domain-containing protein [Chloroflexota bacterium]